MAQTAQRLFDPANPADVEAALELSNRPEVKIEWGVLLLPSGQVMSGGFGTDGFQAAVDIQRQQPDSRILMREWKPRRWSGLVMPLTEPSTWVVQNQD